MLLVAVAAINWPGAIGLEGNLTCLSALCASGIVHLSRAAAVAASASASISFHLNSLTFGIDSVNRSYILQNIPSNSIEATLMQHHQSGLIALYTCWLTLISSLVLNSHQLPDALSDLRPDHVHLLQLLLAGSDHFFN